MTKLKKIFICCTEQSGDNIAYNLLNILKKKKNLKVEGVCGKKAQKYFTKKYYDISDFKSMGIFEIIFSIFKYIKIINHLNRIIIKNNYDLILTIDSPDFNYPLAKKIKKNFYKNKIIHIVAPSVWAWRPDRARKFAIVFDEIFTLFKFENKYFTKYNLKTTFIGHPIFHIPTYNYKNKKFIAFLPGSREGEVLKLFRYYEIAYKILLANKDINLDIFIPTLPHLEKIIKTKTKEWKIKTVVTSKSKLIDESYKKVKLSLTCSGTATLEIAKRNIPQLIIYKFNFMTTIIGKMLVNVKYANLINIFSNKMIIPELTNFNLNDSNFIKEFKLLILDEKRNIQQINKINKYLKYFENNKSPYQISSDKIIKYL